jgi:aerobic-type carbon monoxide dehydrogenase small subunit (CoxS/CutS family)
VSPDVSRESNGRTAGIARGQAFELRVDGGSVPAHAGETIAAALLAAGRRALRRTATRGEPRGVYCAMGVCGECVMVVDGAPGVRTCVTLAAPGMTVQTQEGWAAGGAADAGPQSAVAT